MPKLEMPNNIVAIEDHKGRGSQFLKVSRLKQFQALKFGMFIHYGMSTFDGKELSAQEPIETYNPTNLDVDQWIRTAAETGMRYAVLTAKHVAGHALWPTKYGKYSVKYSPDKTDVVGEFVKACKKYGLKPCLYYCAWDNTNLFGMKVTRDWNQYALGMTHTNDAYIEFMNNQIKELLTNYGPIEMLWVDMPAVLPMHRRFELYSLVKKIDPNIIFTFNHSCQDGTAIDPTIFWPTDVMTMERVLPNQAAGHALKSYYPWKEVLEEKYFLPGEFNDTIGRAWFWTEADEPRNELDLLGIVLATTSRGVNCLLNVPPSREGTIPSKYVNALQKLRENLDKVDFFRKNNLE